MVLSGDQDEMIPTYFIPKAAPPDDGRSSRVTLDGALLLANILFVALCALTLVAGAAALMLGHAVDRAKDHEIATLRIQAASATATGQMAEVEARMLAWLGAHPPSPEPQAVRLPNTPAPLQLGPPPTTVLTIPAHPAVVPEADIPPLALEATSAGAPAGPQRNLTPTQRQRMEAILRLAPSLIMITTDGRSEPEHFADELQSVFTDAGWHVERAVYASLNRPLAPLSANLKSSSIDVAVGGAFAASGMPLKSRDPPQANADREIFVGSAGPHG